MNGKYFVKDEATLSTSQISKMIGFQVSVDFLKKAGAKPVYEYPQGVLWRESDLGRICLLIAIHLMMMDCVQPLLEIKSESTIG